MCMEGGERVDSSVKSYLRKVIDKRRRWSRLILIIVIYMYTICMITVSK